MDFVKHETINMKSHPDFNERWVQKIIAQDPSIIGLGNLDLIAAEKIQQSKGRLDLLLADQENVQRYEVEIQLGATDESHIIRTIEYWDNEKKKYPMYEHCAVIIAEDITSRFLNVISLFNGAIPLVAIKMKLIKIDDKITLDFTKVLDKQILGLPEEEEQDSLITSDRSFWEKTASKQSLLLVDQIFEIVRKIEPSLKLNYLKRYIGIARGEISSNFVYFKPKQKHVNFYIQLPRSTETDSFIQQHDFEMLSYKKNRYCISLLKDDVDAKAEAIRFLSKKAFDRYFED